MCLQLDEHRSGRVDWNSGHWQPDRIVHLWFGVKTIYKFVILGMELVGEIMGMGAVLGLFGTSFVSN